MTWAEAFEWGIVDAGLAEEDYYKLTPRAFYFRLLHEIRKVERNLDGVRTLAATIINSTPRKRGSAKMTPQKFMRLSLDKRSGAITTEKQAREFLARAAEVQKIWDGTNNR